MKKFLSILLAVLLALTCIPFAFAEDAKPAQTPDCIKWEVSFDKEEYGLFDTVTATIKMTNTSDKILTNTIADIRGVDFEPYYTHRDIGIIPAGCSYETIIKYRLSSNADNLNFFAKLLLKIREFFLIVTGRNSLQTKDIKPVSSYETSADFGGNGKRKISILAYYEIAETDTESIAEALEMYNKAAGVTDKFEGKGYITLIDCHGDGINQSLLSLMKRVGTDMKLDFDEFPGNPPILVEDVAAASVNKENGKTKVMLLLKGQTNDFEGKPIDGESVSRGFGSMSGFATILAESGIEIVSGKETATIEFSSPIIYVEIDDSTGKITDGCWYYRMTVKIGDMKTKIGRISVDFTNFEMICDTRTISL